MILRISFKLFLPFINLVQLNSGLIILFYLLIHLQLFCSLNVCLRGLILEDSTFFVQIPLREALYEYFSLALLE